MVGCGANGEGPPEGGLDLRRHGRAVFRQHALGALHMDKALAVVNQRLLGAAMYLTRCAVVVAEERLSASWHRRRWCLLHSYLLFGAIAGRSFPSSAV